MTFKFWFRQLDSPDKQTLNSITIIRTILGCSTTHTHRDRHIKRFKIKQTIALYYWNTLGIREKENIVNVISV